MQRNIEGLYFKVKHIFLSKFNTFSLFFLDFEFKKLKKSSVERPEESPLELYNDFQLQKKSIPGKDIKLIEEIVLSLNEKNSFFYSDGQYQPLKILKSKLTRPSLEHNFPLFQTAEHQEETSQNVQTTCFLQVRFPVHFPLPLLERLSLRVQPQRRPTSRGTRHLVFAWNLLRKRLKF